VKNKQLLVDTQLEVVKVRFASYSVNHRRNNFLQETFRVTDSTNAFERAVQYVLDHYTLNGKPINHRGIQQVLSCSHTWFYGCLVEGTTSLPTALKLETLTHGTVGWRELCPKSAADVDSIYDRIDITENSEEHF
jgi:hypothetical protein